MEKEWTIVTPEQVQLQFQTAGIGSRAIAHVVDLLILLLANLVIIIALGGGGALFAGKIPTGLSDYVIAFGILFAILLNVGYFICMEYYKGGQTWGKQIVGIRVIQDNGQAATFLSIMIRNFFRLLDLLPFAYFLGAGVMFFSARDKRIGDMVAGTIVIIELHRERLKRRSGIDKAIEAWPTPLPVIVCNETDLRLVTAEDWLLLQTWIENLPMTTRARLDEWSVPIAHHLAAKLHHHSGLLPDSSTYLVALYQVLRDDWEI